MRSAVASGSLEVASEGEGVKRAATPKYSTAEKQIIPLWPLELALGILCAASLGLLLRQRFP